MHIRTIGIASSTVDCNARTAFRNHVGGNLFPGNTSKIIDMAMIFRHAAKIENISFFDVRLDVALQEEVTFAKFDLVADFIDRRIIVLEDEGGPHDHCFRLRLGFRRSSVLVCSVHRHENQRGAEYCCCALEDSIRFFLHLSPPWMYFKILHYTRL